MGSKSSSSSPTTTTTNNLDNKVAASDEGVALGAGATLTINDNFPDSVAAAFEQILNFTSDTVNTSLDVANQSLESAKNASNTAVAALSQKSTEAQLGTASILKDFVPLVGLGIAGAIAIMIFRSFKKS